MVGCVGCLSVVFLLWGLGYVLAQGETWQFLGVLALTVAVMVLLAPVMENLGGGGGDEH